MKYSITFICQQGELEIKAVLLAASLKRYLRDSYECVVAIPEPVTRWGVVSPLTLRVLEQMGVRFVSVTNRIDDGYPIGNKVACLEIETTAETRLFLDTDILCLRPFSLDNFVMPFSAKPADLLTSAPNTAVWQQIYDGFQLPLPSWRVVATVSGEVMLPYFNAGVIALDARVDFARTWEACCQIIEANPLITHKRPWLDQLALSVTLAKLNIPVHCLDERFNYPAHLKPLPTTLPFLCHYHGQTVLRREPRLNSLVVSLVKAYPEVKQLILGLPTWSSLLKSYQLYKPPRRLFTRPLATQKQPVPALNSDAIITGIPRSGTSYLCRLLHSLQDCVVINEPTPIFAPLTSDVYPWQLAVYYQTLRQQVLDGQPIENKLHNGQLIEDTAVIDTRELYTPHVSCTNFLLCTKNTLTYMARIPQLKRVLPHAPIIACVRHPLDTMASWKTSFPHLKHATVTDFPVGHVNDPLLAQWQRDRLQEIAVTSQDAVKRALLWRYLAECLLMEAHHLIIIRYEDLVRQPTQILQMILHRIPTLPTLYKSEKMVASVVRQKREVLTAKDIQAVNTLCHESAVALGYG